MTIEGEKNASFSQRIIVFFYLIKTEEEVVSPTSTRRRDAIAVGAEEDANEGIDLDDDNPGETEWGATSSETRLWWKCDDDDEWGGTDHVARKFSLQHENDAETCGGERCEQKNRHATKFQL